MMMQQQQNYYMPKQQHQQQQQQAVRGGAQVHVCPICSFQNVNEQQVQRHQFDKNHVFFCGFESTYAANNHVVECDKWFNTQAEMKNHQQRVGHFYEPAKVSRNKKQPQQTQQQPMSRAHDFYEDMRAQNRQVPMQQPRQQKMAPRQQLQQQQQQPQYEDMTRGGGYGGARTKSQQNNRAGAGMYLEDVMVSNQQRGKQNQRQMNVMPVAGQNPNQPQKQQPMAPIFECVACQKQFATQGGLVSHVEKKHPEQGEVRPGQLNLGLIPIDKVMKPLVGQQRVQQSQQQPQRNNQQMNQNQMQRQQPMPQQQQPQVVQQQQQQRAPQKMQQQQIGRAQSQAVLQQHDDVAPASCNQCGKEFPRGQIALERHQSDTGHTQECACEVCGKVFMDDGKLTQHMNSTGHYYVEPKGRQQQQPKKTTQGQQQQQQQQTQQQTAPKQNNNANKNTRQQQETATNDSRQGRNKNGQNPGNQRKNNQQEQHSAAAAQESETTPKPQIFKCEVCFTVYKSGRMLNDHRKTPEHSQKVIATAQKYSKRTQ